MSDSTENETSRNSNNGLAYVHRDGAIFAKIWRNQSEKGDVFYSTTVGKTYTDKQTGEPRDTSNLHKSELLRAQFLIGEAYRTIGQMQELGVEPEHLKPTITQQHSPVSREQTAWLNAPEQSAPNTSVATNGVAMQNETEKSRSPEVE